MLFIIFIVVRYVSKISYVFPRVCADSLRGKLNFFVWYSADLHSVFRGKWQLTFGLKFTILSQNNYPNSLKMYKDR